VGAAPVGAGAAHGLKRMFELKLNKAIDAQVGLILDDVFVVSR
jgi:hypothetical protein